MTFVGDEFTWPLGRRELHLIDLDHSAIGLTAVRQVCKIPLSVDNG